MFADARVIFQAGPMAPPSPTPQFPADLAEGERVVVYPPLPDHLLPGADRDEDATSRKRFLWLRDRAVRGTSYATLADGGFGPRARWCNDPGPGLPQYGRGDGGARLPSPSIWRLERDRKVMPDFWGSARAPNISRRLFEVLTAIDRSGFVDKPVHILAKDGGLLDDTHHVIDVIRCVEAIDYANSVVSYLGPIRYRDDLFPPRVEQISAPMLCPGLDPDWHIFRQSCANGVSPGHGNIIVSRHVTAHIAREMKQRTNLRIDPVGENVII